MAKFGPESKRQLKTCDKRLQLVMNETIKLIDFSVLEGHRGQAAQNAAYARGASQVKWPHGKHNQKPSKALDTAPYPIDWGDPHDKLKAEAARQRFCLLAGYVLCTAARLGVPLRWGGDWDGDQDTRDEKFRDLGHFEIDEEE